MPSIDEKIVKLSVDDADLEKGTKRSISALDQLKEALTFKNADKGLENITKAARKVDLTPISNAVSNISYQFNLLDTVAATAIFNITNRAINVGERLIKSLSVDQISAGWEKFGEKTSAVQTIMAATSQEFSDTATQMKYVEEQLDKLNWFTDETSYNFTDMVNSIGKFTSAGQSLDRSVDAMQGIATWAARSGAGIQGASRAMYNLAQAMSIGRVQLMDWRSIEMANMSTIEFKTAVMETAVELGTLTKVADGLYSTLDGTTTTIEGMNDSLQKGWFTSDVLMKTLEKYGGFATELNKLYEELDATVPTTTLIGFINDYIDGSLDMQEAMTSTGMTSEELTKWFDKLGSKEYELGRQSFKAAQETKTFGEVIAATTDAVSTGWMKTFEMLFGNYEEAKEFFSAMSEWFYDLFVSSGEARNSLLRIWKDEGGRDEFISGLEKVMENISNFVEMIREAWRSVFPESTVNDLWDLTDSFNQFIKSLTLTKESTESIKKALSGFFSIIKVGRDIIVGFWNATEPLRDSLNRLAGSLVWVFGKLGEKIFGRSGTITDSAALKDFYKTIYKISEVIGDKLLSGFNVFYKAGLLVSKVIGKIIDILKNGRMSISEETSAISSIFGSLFEKLKSSVSKGSSYTGIVAGTLSLLGNTIRNFTMFLGNFLISLSDSTGKASGMVGNIASMLGGLFKGIAEMFSGITIDDVKTIAIIGSLTYLVTNLGSLIRSFRKIGEDILEIAKDSMQSVSMGGFISQLNSAFDKTIILQIAVSITLLVNALSKLANMDTTSLALSVAVLAGIAAGFFVVVKQLEKVSKTIKAGEIAKFGLSMGILATSINIMVSAMTAIGKMNFGSVVIALGSLAAILIGVKTFSESLATIDAGKLAAVSASMSLLAIGLTAMVVPIGLLALIDLPGIATGMVGVLAILTSIALFADNIKNLDFKSLIGASASMVVLSFALNNIGIVVTALGAMDIGSLILGLAGIATILIGLVQTAKAFSSVDSKSLTSSALAITTLAAAIKVVSNAVSTFASLGDSLITGLAGLTAVLLEFVVVIEALKMVSTGMNTGQMLGIGASLLILSTSMIAMAAALKIMQGVEWSTVAMGLVAVAGGLGLLLGAAAIAQYAGLAAGLGTIVLTLTSLSLNILIVAASISIIISAMKEFMNMITILAGAAALFGDDLPKLVQIGVDAFKVAFRGILEAIYENIPQITLAIVGIIAAVKAAVLAAKSDMVLAVVAIGLAVLEALKQFGGPIMDALTYVVEMMTQKLPQLMLALGDFIEQLFAGVGILVTKAIYGLFEAILNLIPFVGQKMAADLKAESELVGQAYLDGFTQTVEDGKQDAYDAAAGVGDSAVDGLTSKEGIDSNSPSKKTQEAGKNFNDGFIDTIESGKEDAKNAGAGIGDASADGTEEGIKKGLEDNKESTKGNIKSWFNDVVGDLDLGVDIPVNVRLFGGSGSSKSDWDVFKDAVTKYGDDAFTELSKMDEDGRLTSGLINRALRSGYISKRQADELSKSIRMEIADNQKEKYEKAGEAIGNYIGTGLSSSKAPSTAARSQAQNIGDAFTDEIKKLDLADKTANSLLSLWKAQNPNATEAETAAKEMELIAGQIVTQSERARYAQLSYTETLEKMGEAASETQEAYIKMIDEQTKLIELQNKLNEAQMQGGEQTTEAFQRMSDVLHDYYYAKDGGRSTAEFLKSLGFTDKEITEAAAREAGYAIPQMVEETKNATVAATQAAGQQTVQLYAQSVTTNLQELTPTFTGFGNTYATSLGNGMVEKTEDVGNAAMQAIEGARGQAGSEEMIGKWQHLGYNLDMGLVAGIEEGAGAVATAAVAVVQKALAAAEMAAKVHSPSGETMWQASMWIAGYVNELENNGNKIGKAIVVPIKSALSSANSAFNDFEFGDSFSKNVIGGVNESSGILKQKIHSLMETTEDEMNAFNRSDFNTNIAELLGIDDEAIHVNVVLDLDDSSMQGLNAFTSQKVEGLPNQNGTNLRMSELQESLRKVNSRISTIEDRVNPKFSPGVWSTLPWEEPVQTFNFTQNNYSPKALSRLDIRRDTERIANQVAARLRSNGKKLI